MKTQFLSADFPDALGAVENTLRRGGLVAFPTDTVYGLGAVAFDATAVMQLFVAKNRAADKAIPVLLGSLDQLELVAVAPNPRALQLASRFWPGPLTIVMSKHPRVPEAVAGATVGIRIPDHDLARTLISRAGPMAVTSANLSGQASPVTAREVLAQLDGRVDVILDGGDAPGGQPSTVVDCTGAEIVVLREGPLSMEDLTAALS